MLLVRNLRLYLNELLSPKIKRFKHKVGIQLNNTPLVIDENNFTSKTVNYYIVYDFDN